MKTQNITPAFTGKFVVPNSGANKQVDFLYNKVAKVVKDNHLTGEFHRDSIVISADKTQEKNFLNSIKELGVKIFSKTDNK